MDDQETYNSSTKFEVMTFSPPAPIIEEEANDIPILDLIYFGPISHVCFNKVKIGASKVRQVLIRNPNNVQLEVIVKKFPYAKGFTINIQQFSMEREEERSIDIKWVPSEEGCFREVMLLQASNGCQKQIILLGTAISVEKKKKQTLKGMNLSRTTKFTKRQFSKLQTEKKGKKPLSPYITPKLVQKNNITIRDNSKYLISFNSENCENDSKVVHINDPIENLFAQQDNKHPLPSTPLRRQTYTKSVETLPKEDSRTILKEMTNEQWNNNNALSTTSVNTTYKKRYQKRSALKKMLKMSPSQRKKHWLKAETDMRRETFIKHPSLSNEDSLEDSLEQDKGEPMNESLDLSSIKLMKDINPVPVNRFSDSKYRIWENAHDHSGNPNLRMEFPLTANGKVFVKDGKEDINSITNDVNSKSVDKIGTDKMCKNEEDSILDQNLVNQENFHDSIEDYVEQERCEKSQLNSETHEVLSKRLSSETVILQAPSLSPAVLPHFNIVSMESENNIPSVENQHILILNNTEKNTFIPVYNYNDSHIGDITSDFSFLTGRTVENKHCSTGIMSNFPPFRLTSERLSIGCQLSFHDSSKFSTNKNDNSILEVKKLNVPNEIKLNSLDINDKSIIMDKSVGVIENDQSMSAVSTNHEKPVPTVFTISPITGQNRKICSRQRIATHFKQTDKKNINKSYRRKVDKHLNMEVSKLQENRSSQEIKSVKTQFKKQYKIPQSKLTLIKPIETDISNIRHPNPFAARNMYYDEKWMQKQEFGFTRWLNFILTPPDDLSTDEAIKVDAAKLWQDNISDVASNLAPTKEQLSFKAYTALRRLNRLRRSACLMYQSQPMALVITRLETEIETDKLVVRKDKGLHADIGIKKYILNLILGYNPLWLRIGLETIFGELIHLHSNNDVLGLSRFIIHRFLNNPDIAAKYAHPKVPHLYKNGYEEELKKFTLKKFLLLVYFLDNAKLTRLIDHDPCLFRKNATYKSSRDLLLIFSREFLSGEGDITRHLRYLGYIVSHSQTALEEFEYAVTNLAVDLRCGLRLARVIELLLKQWSLTRKLRVPAISRLQKIHNVEVAFEAIKLAGYLILDDVSARDIVDGHREKTLSLLWQLIFKTQIEILLSKEKLKEEITYLNKNFQIRHKLAAIKGENVTDFFNGNSLEIFKTNQLYADSEILQLLLQWCQSVCFYYGLQVENFTVSFCDGRAFCYLIHHYHPRLLLLDTVKSNTTQTFWSHEKKDDLDDSFEISSCTYENNKSKNEIMEELLANEKFNLKLAFDKIQELGGIPLTSQPMYISNTIPDEKVVITLVAYLNCRLMDLSQEIRAARIIQLAWNRYNLRRQLKQRELERKAAILIQRTVRSFLAKQKMKRLEKAAILAQKLWRRLKAKKLVCKLRAEKIRLHQENSAIIIQKMYKGYLTRKLFDKKKQAIVLLQASIRRWLAYKKYHKLRNVVSKIQNHYRATRIARLERQKFLRLKKSVILIQSHARKLIVRKQYRSLQKSAIILQSYIRMYVTRKCYCEERCAIIRIQQKHRANLQSKTVRKEFLKLKYATIKIQNWFRAVNERKNYLTKRQAILIIQNSIRGCLCRKRYVYIRKVVINIQRRWRATLLMKKDQKFYLEYRSKIVLLQSAVRKYLAQKRWKKIRNAAIVIQKSFRVWKSRRNYYRMKCAATKIQNTWRAFVLGRNEGLKYQKMYQATLVLQSHFRGYVVRKDFVLKKKATIKIQSHCRMISNRRKFLALKSAALTIEKRRIAAICSRNQRKSFLEIRKSAIIIQSAYRSYAIRMQYQRMKKAIITIQSTVRGWLQRSKYKRIRLATLCIQRYYKLLLLTRYQQNSYTRLRKTTVFIQATYKAKKARASYLAKRRAAIVIQSAVKSWILSKKYKQISSATVIIQRRFRAHYLGKRERENYIKTKMAIVTLQSTYRSYVNRKQARRLKAICTIQAYVRGYTARKKYKKIYNSCIKIQSFVRLYQQRHKYLRLHEAVILVQQLYRMKLETRHQRRSFLSLRAASIKLQSFMRMIKQRNNYLFLRKSCIRIQSAWRGYACRKEIRKQHYSAIIIQKRYRAYLQGRKERDKYINMQRSVIVLQSWTRMWLVRKSFLRKNHACVLIQSYIRAYLLRKRYLKLKASTLLIQQHYRALVVGLKIRQQYKTKQTSVVIIQSAVRKWIARKKFLQCRRAAVKIQAWYKGKVIYREYRKIYSAIVTIQHYMKACFIGKKQKLEYLQMKKAVLIIEAAYKCYQERKCKTVAHVIKIQSLVRRYIARNRYCKLRQSCIKLQALVRMKREREKYLRLRNSAIILQRYFKATIERNRMSKNYQLKRNACIKIQALCRGCVVRSTLQKQQKMAVIIQKAYRGAKIRKEYLALKKATIAIQKRWRIIKLQRINKEKFQRKWKAAITIQNFYQKYCIIKEIRTFYSTCVLSPNVSFFLIDSYYLRSKAAVKIQTWYRMIICQRTYSKLRTSPIILEYLKKLCEANSGYENWRLGKNQNDRLMKSYQEYYNAKCHLIQKAITLQSWYRACRQKSYYLKLVRATIILQRRWRLYLEKCSETKRVETAAVIIQRWYRRRTKEYQQILRQAYEECDLIHKSVEMKEGSMLNVCHEHSCIALLKNVQCLEARQHIRLHKFVSSLRIHISTICIQRCYRKFCLRKLLERQINSVLVLQKWFRAKLIRIRYLKLRQSVISFQRAARQYLLIRHQAAIKLQGAVRSWLVRNNFAKLHKAAATIQAAWHGYKQRCISDKQIKDVRSRLESASALATEDMKLSNRTSSALYLLLGCQSLTHILTTLKHLDVASRLSDVCCEKMAEGRALDVLLHILHCCNRSVPHMELIKYTINILLNLAKYDKTVDAVWNTNGIVDTVMELMKIYREKGGDIFTKLCTLIWIFCQDPNKAEVIKESKQISEKLSSFHYLVTRKQNLTKRHQQMKTIGLSTSFVCPSTPSAKSLQSQALPKIEPDWILCKNRTREFGDPLTAITAIIKILGISRKESKLYANILN